MTKEQTYQKEYRLRHKEHHKELCKKWYQSHKEENRACAKKWRETHPGYSWHVAHKIGVAKYNKVYKLKNKYNLTIEQVATLLIKQDYKCLICGRSLIDIKQCVDHDHTTGKIRGILCNWCNVGLGSFFDNPELTNRATEYLRSK